jgi:hypothetical protein
MAKFENKLYAIIFSLFTAVCGCIYLFNINRDLDVILLLLICIVFNQIYLDRLRIEEQEKRYCSYR